MEAQVQATSRTRRSLRGVGWVAIASLLAAGLLATSSGGTLVSAFPGVTYLHQTPPILSTDPAFQGDEDCDGLNLAPGQVLWHFVLVQVTPSSVGTTGSNLHATFGGAADVELLEAYKKAGGVLHWEIINAATSLTGAHTNRAGRWLNLSHICQGPPTTTTTSSTTTTTTTSSTTTQTTTSVTTTTATAS